MYCACTFQLANRICFGEGEVKGFGFRVPLCIVEEATRSQHILDIVRLFIYNKTEQSSDDQEENRREKGRVKERQLEVLG